MLKPIVKISLGLFGLTISLFVLLSFELEQSNRISDYQYHSLQDFAIINSIQDLPTSTNTLFSASGNCELCHGDPEQFPGNLANTDSLGNDVSPVSLWRATMMANSALDPCTGF